MTATSTAIEELTAIAERGPEALLAALVRRYPDRVTLASSLGAEDQVLTHMLLAIEPRARIFVLDTGRLHQETYDLVARTMSRYGMRYEVLFPDAAAVQEMVSSEGPNLFYASVAGRKRCCAVRKVEPLRRALAGAAAWITGLRRAQSPDRAATPPVEWDAAHGALKVNPLAEWSEEQVWDFLRTHQVPYNELHDRGFPSIGCAPCTRAVEPGEPARAGRWWWEQGTAKECGLHVGRRPAADAVAVGGEGADRLSPAGGLVAEAGPARGATGYRLPSAVERFGGGEPARAAHAVPAPSVRGDRRTPARPSATGAGAVEGMPADRRREAGR